MNLSKLPTWQKGLLLFVSILAVLTLGFFQVYTSESATKVESALFNVLQFIFSILFAWFLSAFIGESQFIESQKKFAIGAFRRIKEIERSINRTQKYVHSLENESDEIVKAKIIAIKGGLSAMQDTVRSSIADWSDIIGDEIQITNEINKLSNMRGEYDEVNENISIEDKIKELVKSLPKEIANDYEPYDSESIENCIDNMANMWMDERQLFLYCFWDKNGKFKSDLSQINVDMRLFLARGMTESRMGALMLFDSQDRQIAVVTNLCDDTSYEKFVESFELFYGRKLIPSSLGGNPLSVKIINIEPYDFTSERQYITVIIEQMPQHECIFEDENID